jgi:hypothetical protein
MRIVKFPMRLMLSMLLGMFATAASADWNGTACWTLGGPDQIQLDYSVGPTGQVQVAGKWIGGFPPNRYYLAVTGGISSNTPGSYRMGLHGAVEPGTCIIGDPADPVDVAFNATFTSPSFGGTWQLQCGTFKNAGTLTLVTCPIQVYANGTSGPSAFRPE